MKIFDCTLLLRPSFHENHEWVIDVNDNEGNIRGKCKSASATVTLPQEKILDFLSQIKNLDFSVPEREWVGLDGITVHYTIHHRESDIETEIWGPNNTDSRSYNYLAYWAWITLYGVNAKYDKYLEQIYGYFSSWGAPLLKTGNKLKIFGRLSTQDQEAIENQFYKIANEKEAVIDMTNFEGMGTLLLPLFKEFALENPKITWRANQVAAKYLNSIEVPYEQS